VYLKSFVTEVFDSFVCGGLCSEGCFHDRELSVAQNFGHDCVVDFQPHVFVGYDWGFHVSSNSCGEPKIATKLCDFNVNRVSIAFAEDFEQSAHLKIS